ncbi:MAG: MoaD family protein [Promethearchaeia archaeon]
MLKIVFLSFLKDITGIDEYLKKYEEGMKISSLIDSLIRDFGEKFKELIYENNKLSKFILIGLNGRDIRALEGLNTPLKDGDFICLLPAIGGG